MPYIRSVYMDIYESAVTRGNGEPDGWYLGIAREFENGYNQLAPGYGPYKNEQAARAHANELNKRMGYSENDVAEIIASTMRGSKKKA